MAIIRTNKVEDQYARISRYLLQDDDLSWAARGLAAYLLSKPADWQIEVPELVKSSPGGRKVVYSILLELEEAGYIVRQQMRIRGRYHYDYYLYESKALAELHVPRPVPVRGIGDRCPSPMPVTDARKGHRSCKEEQTKESQTKESQTKDHTQTPLTPLTPPAPATERPAAVCVEESSGSVLPFEQILEWAEERKRKGEIKNPMGLAIAVSKTSKLDQTILNARAAPSPGDLPPAAGLPSPADEQLRKHLLEQIRPLVNEDSFAEYFETISAWCRDGTRISVLATDRQHGQYLDYQMDVLIEAADAAGLGVCTFDILTG